MEQNLTHTHTPRVLRGGAFWNRPQGVRCAYRGWDHPYLRYDSIGCRVVVLPSSLDSGHSDLFTPKKHTLQLFTFREIPAGPFIMGSNDIDMAGWATQTLEHTEHTERYWIAQTSITRAQYEFRLPTCADDSRPKTHVSWYEATTWCVQLETYLQEHPEELPAALRSGSFGVQLPTEIQWEKAARGTDGRRYPWGDEPPTKERCNFNSNEDKPLPVGTHPEGMSPYGVHDMAGGVWEWCQDSW